MAIVSFESAAGPVLIEVDRVEGECLASTEPGIVARAKKSFDEALQSARPGIEEAIKLVSSLAAKPTETEISFGLKIDAAAGALFAKAGAEATFNIKLSWKPKG